MRVNYFFGGGAGLEAGGFGKEPGTMPFLPPFEGFLGFEVDLWSLILSLFPHITSYLLCFLGFGWIIFGRLGATFPAPGFGRPKSPTVGIEGSLGGT